ncbi:MAG TPA: hypothetical protein VMG41_15260 [Gemmatimonadales bacterium]|nr:hypothetical protein [Gemmatimonadales bacterium]
MPTRPRPGSTTRPVPGDFDATALFHAMDAARVEQGLSWPRLAKEIWEQSALLNAQRRDHPISPSTLTGIQKRGDCTCQHALFILRWLKLPPEAFVDGSHAPEALLPLPDPGPERRFLWDLRRLCAAVDTQRAVSGLTWAELAAQLHCTTSQLTGLRKIRFAISMRLAMRLVHWLEQPARAFIYMARW